MSEKETAIVIPCYNEEITITKVIEDFKRELPESRICVFNNNSQDATAEVAEKAGAEVFTVHKQGKGNVVREIFHRIDAQYYLMVDGDDTYPVRQAKELLSPLWRNHYDIVIGDRLSSGSYGEANTRKWHSFGNRLVTFLINRLFSGNLQDIMTGYRAMNRSFVKTFPVMSDGFEVETEMSLHSLHHKIPVLEIPIHYQERPEGSFSKLNTFRDGWRVLRTIVTVFKDYKPLAFFALTGLTLLSFSIGLGIPIILDYLSTGKVARFPTAILSTGLAILAGISFTIGIVQQSLVKQGQKELQIWRKNFQRNYYE